MSEQNNEAGKVSKKYESDLSFMTAVLGGKELFKPSKALPEDVKSAIAELVKDEKTNLIESIKKKAVSIIQRKREHDKHVAQLEKEFMKKKEESMKEFSKEVDELKKEIDNVKEIESSYYNLLGAAATGEESKETD